MGKFTKQKDGRYRTSVLTGYRDDGMPIKKYVSGRTIKELEEKIMQMKTDLAGGLLVNDDTTFGQYADMWLKTYKTNKGIATQAMYENSIKNHMGLVREIRLKDITRMMIQAQINQDAAYPRTCEISLMVMKQIFKSAIADGHILKNPCEGITLPRHVKKEKRALTEEEKEQLRSAVLQPQERILLLTLYGVGCRPAEAYALTKDDIDLKNHCVHITKSVQFEGQIPYSVSLPKTDSSIRDVIVSESILRAIKLQADKSTNYNILGGQDGKIMHKGQYESIFRRVLRKAGLKDSDITMYTFRHNFCTECYYAGVSLKECQRQMGHKDYKMILEIYSHLDSKKENTATKMASMVM